jgi:[methyl-Co(III) methanol-specific corrinoid protein]:coenzyme M methyltransferase
MDKAGVFFPEAHLDAKNMAELAASGHTILGFDNVMPLFSVCHESAALGVQVDWGKKDRMPSTKAPLWKEPEEINNSHQFLDSEYAQVPLKAIAILKKELGKNSAVTGKVFGPWTLAYHVIGMEDFLMDSLANPGKVKKILDKLIQITIAFAEAQIKAGADCITVGDHATRDLCSPETYRDFVMPAHKILAKTIKCPLLLHICGYTNDRMKYINETGMAAFHYDSKSDDEQMRKEATKVTLLGGINNPVLLRSGTEEEIIKDIEKKIHLKVDVIGPECAIPLDTPLENMLVFKRYREKRYK